MFGELANRQLRRRDPKAQSASGYETKLEGLEKSVFENCKFVGIHDFGNMVDVTLRRCAFGGEANVMGDPGSKRLVFEECNFVGTNSNRNHWGAVGGYGEAAFVRCKGKWFDFSGHTKLTIIDCEFESVSSKHDPREVGGVLAPMLIERSKLRGTFDMIVTRIESLTIRDTQIDVIDMNNATVKGDILMERVKGGYIRVAVKNDAGNFSLKDSQLYGGSSNVNETNYVYAGGFKNVLIENCAFSSGSLDQTIIAGGFDPDIKNPPSVLTQNYVIRKSKFPIFDASFLNAEHVVLQGNEIGALNLSSSRIGQLEVTGNTIARSVDFSNTQVKEGKVQSLARGQAKLEGSNIKLPR